ncbi:MAG: acetyl-CoA hydrolase/transferase family protein [Bdellovibrionia bacterium]
MKNSQFELPVKSGDRVFIHGGAATPLALIDHLLAQADRLHDVELVHLHTMGQAPYAEPQWEGHFRVSAFFVGANLRKRFRPGFVDYIPCFLSEIPNLFRSGRFPVNLALVHVSPPDRHGYCTLGTSVDIARAAVDRAQIVVAQVNPRMPRVHGDGYVHLSRFHSWIEVDTPIPQEAPKVLRPEEKQIAHHVASLIEDGSTLQMGIGSIPDAVLEALVHHRHLGIHSEMWSDGVLKLVQSGAVDNSKKKIHPGKIVSGFVVGTQALYDFIDDHPAVVQLDSAFVNDPSVIAQNPKVVAINSAVEVDLTGQICADSIGARVISGTGGQMDFIRGASLSPGGKAIIALTSRTLQGEPRIVPVLKEGAGVVTTRAHVHWVITEHGVADLYGKNFDQRAQALIQIAHPEDQEGLRQAWRKRVDGH